MHILRAVFFVAMKFHIVNSVLEFNKLSQIPTSRPSVTDVQLLLSQGKDV